MATAPNPLASQSVDLSGAPGGDQLWADLFPTEGSTSTPAPVTPTAVEPAAPQSTAPVFQIKTSTGTVYNTPEDAVKGIEQKDQLLAKLRQEVIDAKGIDPLTGREVVKPTPQGTSPRKAYLADARQYLTDLADAANASKPEPYRDAQANLMREVVREEVGSILPLLQDVARERAVVKVSGAYTDFPTFRKSELYTKALEALPSLKEAIDFAEANPVGGLRLDELYRTAYLAARGLSTNSTASPAPTGAGAPQVGGTTSTPTAPARPTLTSQTPTPTGPSAKPALTTSAGRKAIIAEMEAKGLERFAGLL